MSRCLLRRAAVLSLLAAAPSPLLSAARAAEAAEAQALFDDLLVEVLPVGELPGDGATPVTLHLLALDAAARPLSGLELKVRTTGGAATAPIEVAPGLLRLELTPPQTPVTRTVELTVKGKTADKQRFSRTWSFVVQPPVSQRVLFAVEPRQLVLEPGGTASLDVRLEGGSPQYRDAAELDLRATAGAVENLTPTGDGRYQALYRVPEGQDPQVVLFTAVDARDPTRTYGHATLSLSAPVELPVTARPDSSVFVRVADREFGPVQADRRGRAKVPVVIPPGVTDATLADLKDNAREERPLDLELPAPRQVLLFGHYADLPADSDLSVPVRALAVRPDGTPDPAAELRFEADAGAFSVPRHEGNGVYVATYTPPYRDAPLDTELRVTPTGGGPGDALDLHLVPARPAGLSLQADPATLGPDDAAFTLEARVVGRDGAGIAGRSLSLLPTGARLQGAPKDQGGGLYRATLQTTGRGAAEVLATVKAPASTNPVRQVLVLPTRDRLPNDGLSSAMLTILTVDEFGYPVADVPVTLSVVQAGGAQGRAADGELPAKARTDASGIAQVHYTAGRAPGLVNVQVEAAGRIANVGLMQLPPEVGANLSLPLSGAADERALTEAWQPIVTRIRLEREGR